MRNARIYKENHNPIQSGIMKRERWILEFIEKNTRFKDNVMNWDSNTDMLATEIKLIFKTKGTAIEYAKNNNIKFEIINIESKKLQIKSYNKNFE